jgi:hypothetical protein
MLPSLLILPGEYLRIICRDKLAQHQAAQMVGLGQEHPPRVAVSFHRTGMPQHIVQLFEARPAPPPMRITRRKKNSAPYDGLAGYLRYFEGAEGGAGAVAAEPMQIEAVPPPLPDADEIADEIADERNTGDAIFLSKENELRGKKVAELKDELKELGLSTTGKKDDLVARLLEHLRQGQPARDDSDPPEPRIKEEDGTKDEAPPLPEDAPPLPDEMPPLPEDEGEIVDGEILQDDHRPETREPSQKLLEDPIRSMESDKRLWIRKELGLQIRVDGPTRLDKMVQRIEQRLENNRVANEEATALWDPNVDPNVEGDPMCTLFVGNLSQDVSERKLQREFESFGVIKRVRLVHDKYSGNPKGYAFIEFQDKEDMKEAYKVADGTRIEGKRCLVDVERGRTVPGWKPKRLGGGALPGGRSIFLLPKNWKKAQAKRIVFRHMGWEVRETRHDRRHGGTKRGYDGDRGRGYGSHGYGGHGYGSRRDFRYGGRDQDRRGGQDRDRGGYGRREYREYRDHQDYRDSRGYGGGRRDRDDRRRGDRGYYRGGFDRERYGDAPMDYSYREPKRERVSYDDFAGEAPMPLPSAAPPTYPSEQSRALPADDGEPEEGEI